MTELTREKVVRWEDPMALAADGAGLAGREFLQSWIDGGRPAPPIAELLGFRLASVGDGEVTFVGTPDESVYNPIGVVHGGYVATLLDSALGCAVHSTLPAGVGYTSLEIKVNFLRPLRAGGDALTVVGRVAKGGRRVAFADGEVRDTSGSLVATGQSTLLILEEGERK